MNKEEGGGSTKRLAKIVALKIASLLTLVGWILAKSHPLAGYPIMVIGAIGILIFGAMYFKDDLFGWENHGEGKD